ncbi:AI-2E family transporter [Paenibacillus sp. J2TS4]|uniref:AI-2E family transporter n=1 Tax=Paenibacillus sp. J2TS4 TaxID=2807194 RepID=UPI001BCED863|nr:AI-2E family transporter [Paenibacillus sp. J2TS4]
MLKYKRTIYFFVVLIIALLLYKLIDNVGYVLTWVSSILKLLTPFFIAFFIAYLLRPIVNFIESKLHRLRFKRLISILIVFAGVLGFIIVSITYVSPKVIDSVTRLLSNMPYYIRETNTWITENILSHEWAQKYQIADHAQEMINSLSNSVSDILGLILNNITSGLFMLTSTLINIVLGLVISIYMLKDKEKLAVGAQRLLKALFTEARADKIVQSVKRVDEVFSRYFAGVIFDSLIVGFISFLGLLALKAPHALLAAVVITITNVIPYFGPLVGMVFVTIITLFVSPLQAIWVALFVFLVQQFDGYYLGPKILGSKVGISPLWVIMAILIGGGTFGIIGMFIAVPVFSVIKTAIDTFINRKLHEKQNPI